AGLALQLRGAANEGLRKRLDYPQPRIEAGLALRKHASAVIDISDGLLADLGHLLERDDLGARIDIDTLPHSQAFLEAIEQPGPGTRPPYYELPLSAGDDYELCFTVPPPQCAEVEQRLGGLACGCTAIGVIEQEPGIRCHYRDGSDYQPVSRGYLHFLDD
ncbi:MAG: AIR synthase-related protein, partial [Gammaproteobacteria bacterium]